MKKKRPPQQATPPAKGLNILALKRSPKSVDPPQEQPTEVSTQKPVLDATSLEEPVVPTPVDESASLAHASSTQKLASDAITCSPQSQKEPVSDPIASPTEQLVPDTITCSPESTEEPVPDPIASSSEPVAFFQAVGIIKGDITFDEDKTFVTIGEQQYGLYYASIHKRAYDALKLEIENTGVTQQRLIVYPRITHYPGGKQPYRLGFQLAGFVGHDASGQGLPTILDDLEFKISGLWQFIPVCRMPCISVFKNFNHQRLEYIKSAPLDKKVNFMKASHIPVMWRDAPVPPFRFNPKLDKETQGKASFVQIKARFNSARNNFEFVELLATPRLEPPSYLKAGKKDKLEVAKTKRAASKSHKHSGKSVPNKNVANQASGATSPPKPKPKVVVAQQE
ncbi:MAG TPA: hypothetical protein V6C95_06415 [Coleofasciculaceae cyanobacterium]